MLQNIPNAKVNLLFGGVQLLLPAKSGKVYSVIQHRGSYGSDKGKWEILLEDHAVGYLSFKEVVELLETL